MKMVDSCLPFHRGSFPGFSLLKGSFYGGPCGLSEKAVRWPREAAGKISVARALAASRPLRELLQFWAILKVNQSIRSEGWQHCRFRYVCGGLLEECTLLSSFLFLGVMQMGGVLIWIKAKWTEWNYGLFYMIFSHLCPYSFNHSE